MPAVTVELVWDRVVRSTHWLIAGCVLADLSLLESGTRLHKWVGYAACLLIALRIVWGVVGSRHARFTDWFPLPGELFHYVALLIRGKEPRYIGHNPLGAVMMLFLWSLIVSLGVTGHLLGTDTFFGDGTMEELHEGLANVLFVCVGLHVGAAIFSGWKQGENLVLSMVTGRKMS